MSSHHVVRDAQEPALFIFNPQYLRHEQLAPLLEWSPTIIVRAEVLQEVLQLNIKIDAVICPRGEQQKINLLVAEQAPVTLITLQKEESALLAGLSYLEQQGHRAVNLLVNEKPDQESLLLELARQENVPQVVILAAFSRYALCRTGLYHKWFPAQESIQLFPATEEPVTIITSGFSDKADQKTLGNPISLTSAAPGATTISGSGSFWVMEQLN